MLLMGTDFTYSNAATWYKNIGKLIRAINSRQVTGSSKNSGDVANHTAFFSTPELYLSMKAEDQRGAVWPLLTDDFYPYADSPNTYWAGAQLCEALLSHQLNRSNESLQTING
jgi:alpha-mannosidase